MSTLLILSNNEQEEFTAEPTFTSEEKQYFFKIPKPLLENLNSPKNKLLMTLLWLLIHKGSKCETNFIGCQSIKGNFLPYKLKLL